MKGSCPALTEKLFQVHPDQISISSVTVSELEYGAAKSKWGSRTHLKMQLFLSAFTILPFREQDAVQAGRLRADLAMKGTLIDPYDIMIAAQGLSEGFTVVTTTPLNSPVFPVLSWKIERKAGRGKAFPCISQEMSYKQVRPPQDFDNNVSAFPPPESRAFYRGRLPPGFPP